jgi:hypothetical protein
MDMEKKADDALHGLAAQNANLDLDQGWGWFDVDDVLVESAPLFQASLDKWSGLCVPCETWEHNAFHLFYGVASDDAERMAELRLLWQRDRVLERSPLSEGAAQALDEVHNMGLKIGLITARAWHPDGLAITEQMARDNHLPVERVVTLPFESTKADLLALQGVRVESFLDDTTRHAEACAKAGYRSAVLTRPWNKNAPAHLARVASIAQFPDWLRQQLAESERAKMSAKRGPRF